MWTEIFVTHDNAIVDKLKNMLKINSIISKIIDNNGEYRILVPYAEVDQSLNLIIDLEI